MAIKIDSAAILTKDAVGDAHKIWVEKTKLIAALIIVGGGLLIAGAVLLVPSPEISAYRQNAWTLVTVIVSSALGFLYTARDQGK